MPYESNQTAEVRAIFAAYVTDTGLSKEEAGSFVHNNKPLAIAEKVLGWKKFTSTELNRSIRAVRNQYPNPASFNSVPMPSLHPSAQGMPPLPSLTDNAANAKFPSFPSLPSLDPDLETIMQSSRCQQSRSPNTRGNNQHPLFSNSPGQFNGGGRFGQNGVGQTPPFHGFNGGGQFGQSGVGQTPPFHGFDGDGQFGQNGHGFGDYESSRHTTTATVGSTVNSSVRVYHVSLHTGRTPSHVGLVGQLPSTSQIDPCQLESTEAENEGHDKENNATPTVDQVDDMMGAVSIANGKEQEKSPPAPYVEDVTVSSVIDTVQTIIVTKPCDEASLGIITVVDLWEEVKISKVEIGSPMSEVVERGMTLLAVNGTPITSPEMFVETYNKCPAGKVEIEIGPKNVKAAVRVIKTLNQKNEDLEKEKKLLNSKNEDLEKEKKLLTSKNEDLEKEKKHLEINLQAYDERTVKDRALFAKMLKKQREHLLGRVE